MLLASVMLAVLATPLQASLPASPVAAAACCSINGDGETPTWRSSLPWNASFDDAAKQAREAKRSILAYIPRHQTDHLRPNFERFESDVLASKGFQKLAKDFVLYVGSPKASSPIGALAIEHNLQSVTILDADGWALSRVSVRSDTEGGQFPLVSQIEDLAKAAGERKKLRQRAEKGEAKAKAEWLNWTAVSGQMTDLEDARKQLTALGVPERSDKRTLVEVSVIINEAQASANQPLVMVDKATKGTVGEKLWPYFADGYRPEDDTRDWAYLWCVLQYAGDAGDARGYEKAKALLQKKGACGATLDEMEATLARLKKGKPGQN